MTLERIDLDASVERILEAAATAITERGHVDVVVPGGRGPRPLLARLADAGLPDARWRLHLSDERCVRPGDAASNAHALAALLPSGTVLHGPDLTLPPDEAARRYADLVDAVARFDLVLLGLGADGHTASLFPGDERCLAADAPGALVVDVPGDAHPRRISLSARTLARSRLLLVLVAGPDKDAAVAALRAGEDGPLTRIAGPERLLVDLTDA